MKQWYTTPLQSGYTYHIFNQGNNGENIFKEERNYFFFLKKLEKEILPIMQLFAFVLMPNHFHLMGKIRSYSCLHKAFPSRFPSPLPGMNSAEDVFSEEQEAFDKSVAVAVSRHIGHFMGSYTRAINKAYERKGRLFAIPFRRILVLDEDYFTNLICYIHRNSVHHHFCENFLEWPYSSYHLMVDMWEACSAKRIPSALRTNLIDLDFLRDWFGDPDFFHEAHRQSLSRLDDERYRLE